MIGKKYKSKYFLPQVVLHLFYGMFMAAVSVVLFIIYIKELIDINIYVQLTFIILGIGGSAFFAFKVFRFLFTRMPSTTLLNNRLEFRNILGTRTMFLSDIDTITFQKLPFMFRSKNRIASMLSFDLEGIELQEKGGTKTILFDQFYSNLPELKWILSQIVDSNNKVCNYDINMAKPWPIIEDISIDALRFEQTIPYKGFWLFSPVSFGLPIFLFLAITFPFADSFDKFSIGGMIFFYAFVSFIIWFIAHQLNYFSTTDNYLIASNHIWIWKNKIYKWADIHKIIFEVPPGELPNSMRIILTNYTSTLYPAGTLRQETWKELQKKIEDHKINVEVEFTFYT